MSEPATRSTDAPPSGRSILMGGLLFIVTLNIFLPGVRGEFLNWDDARYIQDCGWLLNLSWQNIVAMFTTPYFSNYHPLTMISYTLDFHVYGGYQAWGFKFTNILLHSATVVVMYAILLRLGTTVWLAFLAALLFAVHPLRLESVVWISERKDVLCGLFYAWAFFEWIQANRQEKSWHLATATCLFLLALLSKAMAISFPLIVILYDALFAREKMRARIPIYLLLIALSVLFAILNKQAQTLAVIEGAPLSYRIWTALYAPLHYAWTTVWPSGLVALYPLDSNPARFWSVRLLSLVACCSALALVVWSWRRAPHIAFALLAAAIVLGPVSGIVAFGSAYAADRYSYLPTLFLLVGLIPVLSAWLHARPASANHLVMGIFGACIIGSVAVTWWLMPTWRTSESLWIRVLSIYPESSKARVNLQHSRWNSNSPDDVEEQAIAPAVAAAGQGDRPRSFNDDKGLEIAGYSALIAGNPDRARELSEQVNDIELRTRLQMAIAREGGDRASVVTAAREVLAAPRLDEPLITLSRTAMFLAWAGEEQLAEEALDRAIVPTRETALAWGELARVAADRQEWEAAERRGKRALAIHPADHNGLRALAEAYFARDQSALAERILRRARRHPLASSYTRVYSDLIVAAIESGRGSSSADRHIQQAIELGRQAELDADQWVFVGWSVENRGQVPIALALYREALTVDPVHPGAAGNVAFLLMRGGRVNDAIALLHKASEAHPDNEVLRTNLQGLRDQVVRQRPATNPTENAIPPQADAPPDPPTRSE